MNLKKTLPEVLFERIKIVEHFFVMLTWLFSSDGDIEQILCLFGMKPVLL